MIELIKGQCEQCGVEFTDRMVVDGNQVVKCPNGHTTDNWDTPECSQFAPTVVKITR